MSLGFLQRGAKPARIALVATITAIAALAAAVFADSSQAARVAADGGIYTEAQRVVTASSAVKGNLGLTVIIVSAAQSEVVVPEDVDTAVQRVRSDLSTLRERAAALEALTGDGELTTLTATAAGAVSRSIDLLEGVHAGATGQDRAAGTNDDLGYEGAATSLDAIEMAASAAAEAAQARIEAEGSRAGSAARMSSLVVALVVPAGAAWSVFSATRRREERLRLRAELEKSIALVQARDDLIAGISHQLRTPLTAIAGYAQTMLEVPDDHDFVVEGLTVVEGQAAELARMVDDLVTMARLEDGPVELRLEAVDAVREIEALLSNNASWRSVRTSLSPATVWIDRLRLRHIVTNLISNAMTHGGPTVIVRSASVDGAYRVAVADDGRGVPSEMIETVFEPYVHSARDALLTGTLGLGLAVAKRLAEQMHCRLTYQRTNGFTLFLLDVPLAGVANLTTGEAIVTSRPQFGTVAST